MKRQEEKEKEEKKGRSPNHRRVRDAGVLGFDVLPKAISNRELLMTDEADKVAVFSLANTPHVNLVA